MTLVRALLVGLGLAVMITPEIGRYRSERRLATATNGFRDLLDHAREESAPEGALGRVTETALAAAAGLPGDSRPWLLAGSSRLVAGNPGQALRYYKEALARGERAEIDLNLGRAYAVLAQPAKSGDAFLRAGWISPALISSLPAPGPARFAERIQELERRLREGRLAQPPQLPE